MSDLSSQIDTDLKKALLNKQAVELSCLRLLKSAVKNLEIANGKAPDDAAVQAVIQKQIKQRQESIAQFEKAGRQELADKEKEELTVLERYLPRQIGDAELKNAVDALLKQEGFHSKKDFGKAMKVLQETLAGKADNRRISALLKEVLQ